MSIISDVIKNIIVFFISAILIILLIVAIVYFGKDIIIEAIKDGVRNAINKITSI